MENKEPLISIIVPVYNASQYLEQCLKSVLGQTYTNIEVICVNDGSTDDSLRILQRIKENDNRLIIVDKKNEGVSAARNDGIKTASGEYLMFVDSDDWLELNTCELVQKNNTINADVLMWSYISEGEIETRKKYIFDSDCFFLDTELRDKLHRRCIGLIGEELRHPELADSLSPVWGKMYRRSLIASNNIEFVDLSEIGTYEDGLFNLSVFEFAKSVVYLNQNLYHYRREMRKSVTSGYRPQLLTQWTRLFSFMENYISNRELGEAYVEALDNRVALSTVGLTLNVVRSDYSLQRKRELVKSYVESERFIEAYSKLNVSYFQIHWKVFYKMCKYRCSLAIILLGMVIQKMITH